jgi:tetratricopeptide (TPR) repeat protein
MFPAHTEDVTSPEILMDQKPPHSSKLSKTEVLLQKAHSLQQSGHLAEAMGCYNQVLALQSDNLEACYGLGKLYEQQNQPQVAINWYFQALAIRYDFLPAYSALVDFCDLAWDERCLRFYETKRFIDTASYDQVRQPIYDRSVGRSRHYEKHLQILKNALRDV